MNRTIRMTLRCAAAVIAATGCLLVSEQAILRQDGSLMTSAEARIGRPLTPMSYAGVARRTTRRAVAYGAAAGAVAVGAAAVAAPAASCVQAVDPYGRVYSRCY
jgi:hypothetical protein